ncbi:MAG: NAD(P)/FAD-dependent oxidoreductase [Oscillospiraceae bacterium]|nr:NAD(P)/FAD-dependent oxidoreductase [Oscillospiraceae bacterium]
MKPVYDILIVGGGVVGSAIARELSRFQLEIAVLEKNLDVCFETSGRNSAVLHGGFAYDPDTLKARLCVEGNAEFDQVAAELDVPFKRTGKVLVGNTDEDMERLKKTLETGAINGARGLSIIDEAELHRLVPQVVGKFALWSPTSGILDPFQYTIGLAENAVHNGAEYYFNTEVTGIKRVQDLYCVDTTQGGFCSKWIINSAGLGCGKISEMLGITGYKLIGSKGDYIILDKKVGPLLPMPVYPVPSNTYMGIHVTPTVDGNVTVGPNAEQVSLDENPYYGVPKKNMDYLAQSANQLWPCIRKEDYIRNYCGILPKWVDDNGAIQDWKIELNDKAPCSVNLIGIESPALTAALPIACYVVQLVGSKLTLRPKADFNPVRKGIKRFAELSNEERSALIAQDKDYGELVCRCEKVTKAELLQAIHNPLGCHTVAGIKLRTRAMMGRCQGGYCQMRMAQLIQQETGDSFEEILYNRNGSYVFTGRVRT